MVLLSDSPAPYVAKHTAAWITSNSILPYTKLPIGNRLHTYLYREQAIIPNLYERPTEATGRILQTSNTVSRRFNIVPANNVPSRRILKISVVILPHRSRTRFHRGFPGRALPRAFPVFPEWQQKLVTLTQIQKDLSLSEDEADTPPTP